MKTEMEMNPVLQSLFDRKSVRAYTEREISEEDVEKILSAARRDSVFRFQFSGATGENGEAAVLSA